MRIAIGEMGMSEDAALEAARQKRNRVLFVVLLVLIAAVMLISVPLFNHAWDPNLSETTPSH